MKKNTYRNIVFKNIHMFLGIFLLLLFACGEEVKTNNGDPTIKFITDSGYTYSDTTIAELKKIKVGIIAKYNGTDKLTYFTAKKNGELYLDPGIGMYKDEFTWEFELQKSADETEEWEFYISDFEGNSASIFLNVYRKDTAVAFSEIDEFLNVKLGAQNNTEYGSFFSFTNGNAYSLQSAFNNQEIMDMVYYYDDFDNLEENVISSPGGNIDDVFTGEYGMSNWDTRNTMRFSREKLDISVNEFDHAGNDSILVANTFSYLSGGRKTKYLQTGDIYSFVTEDNRTGMFKVVNTSGTTGGYIVFDVKIQK